MELQFLNIPGHNLPWEKYDSLLVVASANLGLDKTLALLPRPLTQEINTHAKRLEFTGLSKQLMAFDSATVRKVVISTLPAKTSAFRRLEWARRAVSVLRAGKAKQILVDLRSLAAEAPDAAHALVSALAAADFELPHYRTQSKQENKPKVRQISFAVGPDQKNAVQTLAEKAQHLTNGTNLVRRLALMAGNDLTTSKYVELATQLAKNHGLKTDFLSLKRLQQLGAGAFLAVAQGSEDKGGGILKVMYRPPQTASKKLALVGKGITFDTGGNNLKTGSYMFGMHQDMTGSAVALATIILAATAKWPYEVTAYLAITDNILGPKAYRPNDVVKSLSGLTIEVVDTDAEGRMVLADTLTLAAEEKPDLIVDYGTLTGACIRALGTRYSGAYTNQSALNSTIRKAGQQSGERVWPFPNAIDYGRPLKTSVADIRQCRVTGGVDHIEASYFLRKFIPKKQAWVHVDLSASNHDGGLGHVPGRCTGFGVRFTSRLVELIFGK